MYIIMISIFVSLWLANPGEVGVKHILRDGTWHSTMLLPMGMFITNLVTTLVVLLTVEIRTILTEIGKTLAVGDTTRINVKGLELSACMITDAHCVLVGTMGSTTVEKGSQTNLPGHFLLKKLAQNRIGNSKTSLVIAVVCLYYFV